MLTKFPLTLNLQENIFFEKVDNLGYNLTFRNHEDIRKDLDLLDANTGKETLGMFIAPVGTLKDQIKATKKKVRTWIAHIRVSTIPSKDALHCISYNIMKTLEYLICATAFSREECNQLVKPIHHAAFPKAQLCGIFPHNT